LLIAFGASPTSQYSVKVADFGLSKTLKDSAEYYKSELSVLPIRYSAPEVLKFGKYSQASDVWSFGITIWELMTGGMKPYVQYSNSETIEKVLEGYRLPKPANCPEALYEIMQQCWHEKAEERPTFTQLFDKIYSMYPLPLKIILEINGNTVDADLQYNRQSSTHQRK
jgi:serine/threonine protein kinase